MWISIPWKGTVGTPAPTLFEGQLYILFSSCSSSSKLDCELFGCWDFYYISFGPCLLICALYQRITGAQPLHVGLVELTVHRGHCAQQREIGENTNYFPRVVYSPPGQARCEPPPPSPWPPQRRGEGRYTMQHKLQIWIQATVQKSAVEVQERKRPISH